MNSQLDEEFLHFESKVNQVMKLLEDMGNITKGDAEEAGVSILKGLTDHVTEDNFLVTVRSDRTVLNKTEDKKKPEATETMDQYTFMQQVEQDAAERAKARHERERLAQKFRTLGNDHYRKQAYEKAINMYTKGIDHIKDSPILYNNRALCYIRLKNYKRGIMDCDYVLNKLDEKNLRSWLYRAAAFKRLNDEVNFDTSIRFAKKHNSKEIDYIDSFAEKVKGGGF